jgi:hypothetical protein
VGAVPAATRPEVTDAGLVRPDAVWRGDADAVLAWFRRAFAELRLLGQDHAPEMVNHLTAAHVDALEHLAGRSPAPVRDRCLRLAARFAEYAGWMEQEAGDDEAAESWTRYAVRLSEAGGDDQLRHYAAVRLAELAIYRSDPGAVISSAMRAQSQASDLLVRGLAALREAQGFASLGREAECVAALERAKGWLAASTEPADGEPVLGSTVGDPVAFATGWCWHDLGRPKEAVQVLTRQLALVPGQASRTRARYGARLALSLASSGDVDGACRALRPVLDRARSVDSATVRFDLRLLARELRRWPNLPAVRDVMPDVVAALREDGSRSLRRPR